MHRRLASLIIATAALSLGCTNSPFGWTLGFVPGPTAAPGTSSAAPAPSPGTQAPSPGAPGTSPGAPATSAGGSATSPGAPATTPELPEPEPFDPDASELPAPATDSDLEPAEQASVEAALASDAVKAFLPASLIHDGGVVLFRLLQASWTRTLGEAAGAPRLTLRRHCPEGDCAPGRRSVVAVVRHARKGVFTHAGQSKPFMQTYTRRLLLSPRESGFEATQVSLTTIDVQRGPGEIAIPQVSVFRDDAKTPHRSYAPNALRQTADLPLLVAGTTAEMELLVEGPKEPQVSMLLEGGAPASRIPMRRLELPGSHPRAQHYRASFTVPPGGERLQRAYLDVVAPSSFLPAGRFRAKTVVVEYRVEARP